MDLLSIVILVFYVSTTTSMSFFSANTIAVWVFLLSNGDADLLSLFEAVETI